MNYYSHHIGDFDRATRHLTRIERSVYLDLMFTYYDTEQPLTSDISALCRKIVARSEEEKAAVLAVLDEFFTTTPAGWYHDRCEEELDVYRRSNTQKSAAGKASAAARAARREQAINGNSTTVPTPVERLFNGTPTNQEPITNNQEPVNTPIPPSGAVVEVKKKPRAAFSFKTYLEECKAEGVKPIPDGDAVFAYAIEAGISTEVLGIHWQEFKARYTIPGAKPYKAWRQVFAKSVRGNWFKLWYFDNNGNCALTTAGIQAKNAAEAAKRKAA